MLQQRQLCLKVFSSQTEYFRTHRQAEPMATKRSPAVNSSQVSRPQGSQGRGVRL